MFVAAYAHSPSDSTKHVKLQNTIMYAKISALILNRMWEKKMLDKMIAVRGVMDQGNKKVTWKKLRRKKKNFFFLFFRKILAGGRCPPDPPGFGWGGKAPPDPPLNGRSSHLIEAAKRGRLHQMIFFRRR